MLTCLYNNLTDDGVGLITVPSFEYITDHNTYYELIHDHLAYYTFDSLTYLLNQNGFIVESKEMINRDTLSVMVKRQRHQFLRYPHGRILQKKSLRLAIV